MENIVGHHDKSVHMPYPNSGGPEQSVHPPSTIKVVCVRRCILQNPVIQQADKESLEQTMHMHRLCWAFASHT